MLAHFHGIVFSMYSIMDVLLSNREVGKLWNPEMYSKVDFF